MVENLDELLKKNAVTKSYIDTERREQEAKIEGNRISEFLASKRREEETRKENAYRKMQRYASAIFYGIVSKGYIAAESWSSRGNKYDMLLSDGRGIIHDFTTLENPFHKYYEVSAHIINPSFRKKLFGMEEEGSVEIGKIIMYFSPEGELEKGSKISIYGEDNVKPILEIEGEILSRLDEKPNFDKDVSKKEATQVRSEYLYRRETSALKNLIKIRPEILHK